jgi:hypothetical protein
MYKLKTFLLLIFLMFTVDFIIAQSIPNPCDFEKVTCGDVEISALLNSFDNDTISYALPGRSMPFWFAFGDSVTEIIDTSSVPIFQSIEIINEPGSPSTYPIWETRVKEYYTYLTDVSFSEAGTYSVSLMGIGDQVGNFKKDLVFIVPSETNFCEEVPAGKCGAVTGNQIFLKKSSSNVVPVDEVMPEILVGVIDSVSGVLDSAFSGTIYVEKETGPGELYGILSMSGDRWFNFNNLKFSQAGYYTLRFFLEDTLLYNHAFVDVEVGETANGFSVLPRNNLVVYPNPFGNKIICSANSDLKGGKIELFTCSGQKVLERKVFKSLNQIILDTDDLTPGVYILSITGASFFEKNTFKIVK